MPKLQLEITAKAANPRDTGTNISQGTFARFGARIQNAVDGWFGPGESLQPQAPPGTQPRTFDYEFGVNMQTTRQLAPIPPHNLRQFSRGYPLLRAVIHRIEDRILSKTWAIRPRKLPGEKGPDYEKRRAGARDSDPRIAELTRLFERPDLENNWRRWMRKLLADYLVLDAASIYVQRKNNGKIYRLMVVDGATIVRKVDQQGMTPVAIDPLAATQAWPVAYQQILKGIPAVDLTKKDLVYAAENVESDRLYGYGRVEQVLAWTILGVNRLIHQNTYYTEGSVPDVFAFLPEDTTPDAAEEWDAKFQKLMSGKSEQKRKVWWMPGGTGVKAPVQMKREDLTDKMDEMLNRFICFSFGIAPSSLVPQVNRASAGQMADDADEAGETPVALWVEDTMNEVVQSPTYFGYDDLEFAYENAAEVDALNQAEIDEIYFAMADTSGNGLQVLNEFRERDGLEQLEDNTPEPPPVVAPAIPEQTLTDPAPKTPTTKRRRAAREKSSEAEVLTIDPGESSPAKTKAQKSLAGVLSTYLAKQPATLAKQIGGSYARQKSLHGVRRKGDGTKPDLTDAEVDNIVRKIMADVIVDWSDLIPDVEDALHSAVTSGTSMAGSRLGVAHDIFDQANEWAIEYAEERAAELVGMKYVGDELVVNPNPHWAITETTRENLQELVTEALKQGTPVADLKKQILEMTDFSDRRAAMVATTEVNFANSGGQFEVANLVGHTHKRSILSGDHDIDDDCDENAAAGEDGDGIPIGDLFPDGSERSPFHPFCVCLTQTYTAGKELKAPDLDDDEE